MKKYNYSLKTKKNIHLNNSLILNYTCRLGVRNRHDFGNRLCTEYLLASAVDIFATSGAPPRGRNPRGVRNKDGCGTHGSCELRGGRSVRVYIKIYIQIIK